MVRDRRLFLILAIMVMTFGASVGVRAQEDGPGIWITGAWARPTAAAPDTAAEPASTPAMGGMESGMGMHGSGGVSAAYMWIENRSETGYRLVAAETSAAGVVEIHESTMEGDVMRMRPVAGIEIAAGASAQLQPGGLHIMLMDLQRDLYPGEAIALLLTFEPLEGEGLPVQQWVGALVQDLPAEESPLVVYNGWARPTAAAPEATPMPMQRGNDMATEEAGSGMMAMGGVSAAYMLIENQGDAADRLIAARTDAAGVVEIHESTMEGDVMRMRPVEGIDIAPGEVALLQRGGLHVMLMDLQRDLYPGEAIVVTLVFESGAEVLVPAAVTDLLNPMIME